MEEYSRATGTLLAERIVEALTCDGEIALCQAFKIKWNDFLMTNEVFIPTMAFISLCFSKANKQ